MKGSIAKLLAYWRNPKKTFMLLHPLKAAKLGVAYLIGRKLFEGSKDGPRRAKKGHRTAPGGSRGPTARSRQARGGPPVEGPAGTQATHPAKREQRDPAAPPPTGSPPTG